MNNRFELEKRSTGKRLEPEGRAYWDKAIVGTAKPPNPLN
jgi:hypothetical protein